MGGSVEDDDDKAENEDFRGLMAGVVVDLPWRESESKPPLDELGFAM
jgi:hypothetical protein